MKVLCNANVINEIFWCKSINEYYFASLMKDPIKSVRVLFPFYLVMSHPSGLSIMSKFIRRNIHLQSCYLLRFFCSNIFPSRNQSILVIPHELLIDSIIRKEDLYVGLLILLDKSHLTQNKKTFFYV